MAATVASWIVIVAALYAGAGVLFWLAFLARGIARVDPAAARTGWGFRLAIASGTIALWPLLARRWAQGAVPVERNAHDRAARGER
jgi:hypothetical protein